MGWKNESSKDAFISDMKANGFSQDEIDREVANIEGTQPPAPAAPPAATAKPAPAQPSPDPFVLNPAAPAETLKQMGEAREQQGNTLIGSTMPSGGVWPPNEQNAALYALPVVGLAGYGLYKGAQEIGTGLKNKFFGPSVSEKPPVEPAMLPQAAQQPVTHEQWLASLSPEERTLYARSREAKAAATAATQPLGEWGNIRFDNTEPTIVNDRVGMSSPVGNEPVAPVQTPTKAAAAIVTPAPAAVPVEPAPAPAPAPAPKAKPTMAAPPPAVESKLGKPDLVTGTGMPAYAGQGEGNKVIHKKGEIASLKDIPKGYVFVPGGQNMDIVRNAVGQPTYTAQLKSSGGYPTSPQAAYEQSRDINKALNRPSYEEAKAAGTLPEPTPSITQKVGGLKTVKVAGTTGALILATDLANAAVTGQSPLASTAQGFKSALKSGDYGMAASQAAELLNLHPLGMLGNALFGTSPEELQTLRDAQQARKVGAGRGIAPPSAYQR